jgi:hypothetical protein
MRCTVYVCGAPPVPVLTLSLTTHCHYPPPPAFYRAHDRNIIAKVNTYLKDHDTKGLDITIGASALPLCLLL